MRHTRHITMGVLLALGASGCGGLDNAPFRRGTVHGQLSEWDPSVALVSVMGAPSLRSTVASDGSFTIEQVPAGAAELFIVASASKALRVPVTIQGGQSVSVGPLTPKEASFLSVRVKAPSHERVSTAKVTLMGTPVEQVQLDPSGRLLMGPLPAGCYTLALSLTGFPDVNSAICVEESERKDVKVKLPPPSSGCAVTGCSDDFLCASDGQCIECTEDSQCAPGFSCHGSRCEGEGPLCAPCDGDWQCQAGASCLEHAEDTMACVGSCKDADDCEEGFTCQASQCLPDPARFMGCQAYRQLGAACESDDHCRNLGLVAGLCHEEICTLRCTSGRECPEGFSCEMDSGDRVCEPE
ncbi:carboxypeptidase-like regulatory domain-containing protein [Hyalangium sp.]|uniref:carboxypeptidase-like regulatory domain-containing protein n=1 Tax=Hyalangium sp. TaxID=2028555 RepID=UPI002D58A81C|nr:carboxypeptidase-like regulatory domain-containing protein [Hyalangium sp.]HYH95345.1 carboxypeptidase-like regulatory domain-containing protein [Hyalangium sp.]